MRIWRAIGLGLGVAAGVALALPPPEPAASLEPEAPVGTEAERMAAREAIRSWLHRGPPEGEECGTEGGALRRAQHPPTSTVELSEMVELLGAPGMSAGERAELLSLLSHHSGHDRWRFWTTFEKRADFVDADVPAVVEGLQSSATQPHLAATYLGDRLGGVAWARATIRGHLDRWGRPTAYWPLLTLDQLERWSWRHELGDDRTGATALLVMRLPAAEAEAYLVKLGTNESTAFMADLRSILAHH